jgi:O-antigen ligase
MLYIGVLFFLILQYLRPQEFLPFLRGTRIVFYTMILLLPPWLVTLQRKKVLRTPTDLFVFFFYVIAVLSYWNYWKTHMTLPAQDFGKVFLCYLFVAHVVDTRRKLVGTVWMTIIMLFIVALLAGENVGLRGQYASIGMFDNRNDFAYAIAILLPLALAFFVRGDPFSKVVSLGVIVVGVAQLVATGSRGGMLASLFAVLTIPYMLARSKAGKTIMLTLGIIGLLTAFMMSSRLGTVAGYQEDKSAMGRVDIWAQCLSMFKQHAVLGWGYRTWPDLPGTKRDTHSSYLRALVELGVTGLFICVGIVFFAFRVAYRLTTRAPHPSLRIVALGMSGALVGHAVASLFQTRLYHMFLFVLFAMASALRLVSDREVSGLRGAGARPLQELRPADATLWDRSAGAGLMTPRLVNRKDLLRIGGLTFACWLMHKLFVMRSY